MIQCKDLLHEKGGGHVQEGGRGMCKFDLKFSRKMVEDSGLGGRERGNNCHGRDQTSTGMW